MSGSDQRAGEVLLENVVTFVRLLRRSGVRTTLEQGTAFARALDWIDVRDRRQVFHAARCLMVSRHTDLELFEALFHRFWTAEGPAELPAPRKAPRAPRHDDQAGRPFTVVSYLAWKAKHLDREVDVTDRTATYTDDEILQRKDFSALAPEELEAVRRMMTRLRWRAVERQTRRRRPARRGPFADPRATLRDAARHGGVPLVLRRARPKVKRRPLVLLADVSGSMEKLSRLVLQFFYGMEHGLGEVEAFLFGTRLTRITPALRHRNVDRAVEAASRLVGDWAGGTRIGESLATFNRRWGRRVLRRGAVVIVVSDGWERGDCSLLARETAYLKRRCHRLIWLNPLAGRSGYEPRVEGMAAALPHLDDFLPVHNLQSLEALVDHLGSLPSRRGGPPPTAHRVYVRSQESIDRSENQEVPG